MNLDNNDNYTKFGFEEVGHSYKYDLGAGLEFAKYKQEGYVRLQTDRTTIPLRGAKTFADLEQIKQFIYPNQT